ncbi:MAG: sigma-54 dependent transcriptional regulator [Syntrophomonas sp.]
MNILVVDDHRRSRTELSEIVKDSGHNVFESESARQALKVVNNHAIQLVLTDNRMPEMSGIDLLKAIKELPHGQDIYVVILTGFGDMSTAVEALRAGAYDYLLKPVNLDELFSVIGKVAENLYLKLENRVLNSHFEEAVQLATEETRQELIRLKQAYSKVVGLENIVTNSAQMKKAFTLAEKMHEDRSVPILIEGETGTGKEVIARYIHYGQGNATTPFIALNCAAFASSVFESELFGYEPGAFTGGLSKGQKGKLDMANGGTLFLDEVSELPLELQAKLLRVLQEKEYFRVGGLKVIKTDARIIGATNQNIEMMVSTGKFRQDLYYRLNVGRIYLPPLRNRVEDILPLAYSFLGAFAEEKGSKFRAINKEAGRILESYRWPGNVREIRNAMQRVVLLWDDHEVKPKHLEFLHSGNPVIPDDNDKRQTTLDLSDIVLPASKFPIEEVYNAIVKKALELNHGNKTKTAQYLNISRNSLMYRLKQIEQNLH